MDRERAKQQADFIQTFLEIVKTRQEQNKHLSLQEIGQQVREEMEGHGLQSLVKILPELSSEEVQ